MYEHVLKEKHLLDSFTQIYAIFVMMFFKNLWNSELGNKFLLHKALIQLQNEMRWEIIESKNYKVIQLIILIMKGEKYTIRQMNSENKI